jgi:CRISPR-associated protein Cas5d
VVGGHSDPFRVRARGALACFTRPEMKVERVGYEVMTPSAARGLIEAILWKPQICWHIHAIEVLAPIRWVTFRRNEVQSRASQRGGEIIVDEDRTQRNTVALRDVDYVIVASFALGARAGAGDNVAKYVEMFLRRLRKGQQHHAPYLGCREFDARVELAAETPSPIDPGVDRPLGEMFYDFDWLDFAGGEPPTDAAIRPLFFSARLSGGVLRVPHRDEVRAMNLGSER